ncbi:MAG TPA: type IV pilus twitching motility protein PilT [Fimbriimonadales bacterium]|jgi:twitching motility protein PilT|nr:type IV pilus twitching motility protein PilT [Fimbriimonadales bacterium]
MQLSIDELLTELVDRNGSDLHIKAGEPPVMRIHGSLVRTNRAKLGEEEATELLESVLSEERIARLQSFKELDLSHEVPGVSRFRVNMFWHRGSLGGVFRAIPFQVKTIDDLKIPQVTKELALLPRGLILVTGPTGSGKSTTLAAIVNHINQHRKLHVMTIEDPIEYMHSDNVSVINQRELGIDTHSFADALRHVMRQNPDVILVGEMRDLETIQLAITAAETGHLVLSTLHTVDAAQTIDRMVDVFDPDQQAQIRTQLSVTLQAVISQALLPTKNEKGRVAAFEVMVATPSIRTLVREGKTHQIYLDIQTGHDFGMQTLDSDLLRLLKAGEIDYDHAMARSQAPLEFERRAINLGVREAKRG